MARKTQHVTSNPNGGWDIKKGGSEKATKHYETKQPAIEHAKKIAINQKAELVIHGKNGKIQNSNSYGNDPCPPLDKK